MDSNEPNHSAHHCTFCEHTAEMLEGVSLPILIGAPDEPHLTNSFLSGGNNSLSHKTHFEAHWSFKGLSFSITS